MSRDWRRIICQKVDSVENAYAARLTDAISLLNTNIATENAIIEKLKSFSGGTSDLEQLKTALKEIADKTDPKNPQGLYVGAAALSKGTAALLDGTAKLKSGVEESRRYVRAFKGCCCIAGRYGSTFSRQ